MQAHGPEINGLIPAGRLHPKGVPDYNTTIEVVAVRAPVKVEEVRM